MANYCIDEIKKQENFTDDFYMHVKAWDSLMMNLADEIKQLLIEFRDTHCGGQNNTAAQALGVPEATFWRWANGKSLPMVESLVVPFEKLKARIVVGESPEMALLKREYEKMEIELQGLRKLAASNEELIALQKETINRLKKEDAPPPAALPPSQEHPSDNGG